MTKQTHTEIIKEVKQKMEEEDRKNAEVLEVEETKTLTEDNLVQDDQEQKELLENLKDPLFVNFNLLGRLEEIRNLLFDLVEIKKAESKINQVSETEEMEGVL